jgi:Fe-S-cluster-containing hydrogenase component 2
MKGGVAILECPQAIPCNPCESACAFGAIKVGAPITNIPKVDWEKCTGCGSCVHVCPGLAIFIVDGDGDVVGLPFEFLPLPAEGEDVLCLDRQGKVKCQGRIVKVVDKKHQDHTAVVYVKVPRECLMDVRNIKRKEEPK